MFDLALTAVNAYPNWVKCYMDLDSSEAMMGGEIIDYEEADEKLHLEVKAVGDSQWTSGDLYQLENGPSELKVRLSIPESFEEDFYDTTTMFAMEVTEGAKFSKGTCDGRRASGRDARAEKTLKVDGSISSPVYIWAGWAQGYEPVTLTKRFELRPADFVESTEL